MAGLGRIADELLVDGLDLGYVRKLGFWNALLHYRETGKISLGMKIAVAFYVLVAVPLCTVSALGPFYTEKDVEGMTLVILNPMSCIQTVVKVHLVWFGLNAQCQLLDLLKTDFLQSVPADKKSKAKEILREAAIKGSYLANTSIWVDVITVSIWNIIPLLRSNYMYNTLGITLFGNKPGKNQLLGFWYPVDKNQSPWTESIYVYEFTVSAVAAVTITLTDGILIQILYLLIGHLKVLQHLMEELKSSEDNFNVGTMVEYVKDHQRLIEYADLFKHLYSGMMTLQICTGTIILIITIFNFFLQKDGDGDLVVALKFIAYLMYVLVEVAVFCYGAGELETTSEDIGFSAYDSEWYSGSMEFKKTVLMMMVRSHNPMTIQFGRMYPLNLIALNSILQSAYSTSMLLFRTAVPEE